MKNKMSFLVILVNVLLLSITASLCYGSNPLSVPFKCQTPPGTTATHNCGQTATLMVMSYWKGSEPTVQDIKDIDDWLFEKYKDPINNYNGSDTNITKLLALSKEYGGFINSYKGTGWTLKDLKESIDSGHPIIAAVTARYLSNRGYNWTGGHFVVVIGYTATDIICNDPGTRYGKQKYYSNDEFTQAFSSQGGAVVVVVPSTTPGGSCGSGLVYDCSGNCVDSSIAQSWIGDGSCDDGRYGMVLTCGAFNNDGGDCDQSQINPTVAQTPMNGYGGTTFVQWGTGFTPNSTGTFHVQKPDGTEYNPSSVTMDSEGHFEISYTANLDKAPGAYTWWVIDGPTGIKSNEVTYLIYSSNGGSSLADSVFDDIERRYSQYFSPHQDSQVYDVYYYRYYSSTNSFLVEYNGDLWYSLNGVDNLQKWGPLSDWNL